MSPDQTAALRARHRIVRIIIHQVYIMFAGTVINHILPND